MKKANGAEIDLFQFPAFAKHAADPRNYVSTILDQIDRGMYSRWLPPIDKPATIVDIGANVGMFSIHCAIPGWRVIAFEPTPEFCTIFREIASDSGLDRDDIHDRAVSDGVGYIGLVRNKDNTTTNHVLRGDPDADLVKCESLNSIIDRYNIPRIDFLKIDAEGSEPAILSAASDETFARIGRFFIEFHDRGIVERYSKLLRSKGFEVHQTDELTLAGNR